ncbi:UNVERIFIED_CONTAM: foldase protein PrsA [Acetivibrio alkalicellulosi]
MSRKKTISLVLTLGVIVFASLAGYFFLLEQDKEVISRPFGFEALKIDGNFVSVETFLEERNKFFDRHKRNAEMMHKGEEERNDILLEHIIENIILEDYTLQKSGIVVTDEEIDEYIKKYIDPKYISDGDRLRFMSSRGYANEEEMREGIREYIIKHRCFYNAALDYDITVSEDEFSEKYESHKIQNKRIDYRHILISTNDRSNEEAFSLANDIYERLINGEDFETMAKEYSDDEETNEDGGLVTDVIWGVRGTELNNIVFRGQHGKVLKPIETSRGYEIVYIINVVEYFRPENEYMDMLIVNSFLNSDDYEDWIDQLKGYYEIEITDPQMKAYRFFSNKEYNQAAIYYEKAYDITKDIYLIERAADSYRLAQNWTELIRVSKKGIKINSDRLVLHLNSAEGHFRVGQEKEALKIMERAERMARDNLYLLGIVQNTYESLGLTEYADSLR